jgi:hypothetical protein
VPRVARRAATFRGSLLINIFRGGPFSHYVGAGGLMRQKFHLHKLDYTLFFLAENL